MRALVIDPNEVSASNIRQELHGDGFLIDIAHSGGIGIAYCRDNTYDLLIMDIQLQDMNGWHALKLLRKLSSACILIVTAETRLSEKLRAFELGADDFLEKPVQLPELLARAHAILRRPPAGNLDGSLQVSDLQLDPARFRVQRGGRRLHLPAKEFALLHLLMRDAGKVVSRRKIISALWDNGAYYDDAAVSVAICRLRSRIDAPFASKLIHTQRGIGYVLEERSAAQEE